MTQELFVRLPRLHPAQIQIVNESKRFNVLACGRRFGKSWLLEDRIARTALKQYPAGWFSPTYKDLQHAFRELQVRLEQAITRKAQDVRIELVGGGSIDFWSLDNPDSGRGFKYKTIAIDEPSKIAKLEQAWTETVRPTLTDYKGDAWFGGTPRGMNYFWQLYQLGLDPLEPSFACWQMPSTANDTLEGIFEEVEDARRLLPQRAYEQEYLAKFLEDGGAVFRFIDEAKTAKPQDKALLHHIYIIGCDWAQVDDFSVFTVIDCSTGEVVYIDRDTGVDYVLQIGRLLALCERFQPEVVVSERTGNRALSDFIGQAKYKGKDGKDVYLPLLDFDTTNESKSEIIQSLALAFEKRKVKILNDRNLIGELMAFTAERLPSGRIRYSAPSGLHDDCVMSLAFAWSQAKMYLSEEVWTAFERAEAYVNEVLPPDLVDQMPSDARIYGQMSRDLHIRERFEEESKKERSWLENLEGWTDS